MWRIDSTHRTKSSENKDKCSKRAQELNEIIYKEDFNTETLSRISKLAGLSTNIQIFPGKPLYFKSNIGNLGEINIYIKSKDQIEKDSCNVDNSDSEYE